MVQENHARETAALQQYLTENPKALRVLKVLTADSRCIYMSTEQIFRQGGGVVTEDFLQGIGSSLISIFKESVSGFPAFQKYSLASPDANMQAAGALDKEENYVRHYRLSGFYSGAVKNFLTERLRHS